MSIHFRVLYSGECILSINILELWSTKMSLSHPDYLLTKEMTDSLVVIQQMPRHTSMCEWFILPRPCWAQLNQAYSADWLFSHSCHSSLRASCLLPPSAHIDFLDLRGPWKYESACTCALTLLRRFLLVHLGQTCTIYKTCLIFL